MSFCRDRSTCRRLHDRPNLRVRFISWSQDKAPLLGAAVEEVEEKIEEIAEEIVGFVEPADHIPVEEGGHVIKQGWLEKQGNINPALQKRWFELEEDALRYYKTSDGKAGHLQPRGMIEISKISGVAEESRRGKDMFEIHTKNRVYYMKASNDHLVHEWVQEVRKLAKLTRTYSVHRSPERPASNRA